MHLLVIKSSSYGEHLSFKVGDGTTDSPPLTLWTVLKSFRVAASHCSAWRPAK
jgi:hypothetical protein